LSLGQRASRELHEYLEQEEVDGRIYRTIDEAKPAIGSFSDDVNNTQRLHSALNCQAPVVFEASRATLSNFVCQACGALQYNPSENESVYDA